jgi:hypothetical protein
MDHPLPVNARLKDPIRPGRGASSDSWQTRTAPPHPDSRVDDEPALTPIGPQLLGHVLHGRAAVVSVEIIGEPFGVKPVVGQEGQLFLFHGTTTPAEDSSNLQIEINPDIAAVLVPDAPDLVVVPAPLDMAAASAGCFFSRRTRKIIRAPGSPKIPLTWSTGRNPGKRYWSRGV